MGDVRLREIFLSFCSGVRPSKPFSLKKKPYYVKQIELDINLALDPSQVLKALRMKCE